MRGRRAAVRWLELLETTAAPAELTSGVPFEPEELSRLEQPILVLVGEHTFTMASAKALERHCRLCHIETIPKAGHFFPINRPIVFARRCGRFYVSRMLAGRDTALALEAMRGDDDGDHAGMALTGA